MPQKSPRTDIRTGDRTDLMSRQTLACPSNLPVFMQPYSGLGPQTHERHGQLFAHARFDAASLYAHVCAGVRVCLRSVCAATGWVYDRRPKNARNSSLPMRDLMVPACVFICTSG